MINEILLISSIQIFPAESGGQIRSSSLIESLANLGHKVDVYSLTGRKADYLKLKKSSSRRINNNIYEFVNRSWWNGIFQYLSYRLDIPPIWATFYAFLPLPKKLSKKIDKSDLIILDFPYMYPMKRKMKDGYILNTHNVESNLWKTKGPLLKWISSLVGVFERKAIEESNHVLFCTKDDAEKLMKGMSDKSFSIINNGVNIEQIKRKKHEISKDKVRSILGISPKTNLILFSASSYSPNQQAFDKLKIFCKMNEELLAKYDVRFLIVGNVSKDIIYNTSYIATSYVDDVSPYFVASDMAINPVVCGSGSNIKMFQYIAHKLPIMTTEFGARGLDLKNNESAFFFNDNNLEDLMIEIFSKKNCNENLEGIANKAYENNRREIDMKNLISNDFKNWPMGV